MGSEAGEVIDVFTKTGSMMYRLLGPVVSFGMGVSMGIASAIGKGVMVLTKSLANLLKKMVQAMHTKYMLNGRASMKSMLWNVGGDASKLSVYTIPRDQQAKFMEMARELHLPYAMVPGLDETKTHVAIRKNDEPLFAGILMDMQAQLASHEDAVQAVTTPDNETDLEQLAGTSLHWIIINGGDIHDFQEATKARDAWTVTMDDVTPEDLDNIKKDLKPAGFKEEEGDELVLVRDDQMDKIQEAAQETGFAIKESFEVLAPEGPPRVPFKNANRISKSEAENAGVGVYNLDQLQPDMNSQGSQLTEKTPDPVDTRFALMEVEVPEGADVQQLGEALERQCGEWDVQPYMALDADTNRIQVFAPAEATGGLLQAAKTNGLQTEIKPPTVEQVQNLERVANFALSEKLREEYQKTLRSFGLVSDADHGSDTLASQGRQMLLQEKNLDLFIKTAAASPTHRARNILIEMAQNQDIQGMLKPETAIKRGYSIRTDVETVSVCEPLDKKWSKKDCQNFVMQPYVEYKDTVPMPGREELERREPLPPEQILAALGKASGYSRNGAGPEQQQPATVHEQAAAAVQAEVMDTYLKQNKIQGGPEALTPMQQEDCRIATGILCRHLNLPDPYGEAVNVPEHVAQMHDPSAPVMPMLQTPMNATRKVMDLLPAAPKHNRPKAKTAGQVPVMAGKTSKKNSGPTR